MMSLSSSSGESPKINAERLKSFYAAFSGFLEINFASFSEECSDSSMSKFKFSFFILGSTIGVAYTFLILCSAYIFV